MIVIRMFVYFVDLVLLVVIVLLRWCLTVDWMGKLFALYCLALLWLCSLALFVGLFIGLGVGVLIGVVIVLLIVILCFVVFAIV